MRARLWILALGAAGLTLAAAGGAAAEPARFHGTGAAARAVGEHQGTETSWGAGALGAAELPVSREVGLQLELGGLFLSDGDPPDDPTIKDQSGANAFGGGVGVRVRPFATSYDGKPASLAGIWLSGAAGVVRTPSDLARGMFDAHVGYDFLYEGGRMGIGPAVGLCHVFQADTELRPADANIILVGVHAMWGTAPPPKPKKDSDRDGDGIIDRLDKCPDDPEDFDNFEDEDGCPDKDNDKDGIADSADHCPNDPEDKDGFEDEDGCPDPDNDKDEIPDVKDKCPDEPEDRDNFEDEDGCPDKDNDKDGIADIDDLCPNEPETVNNYADHDGCPDSDQIRVLGDKIVLDDRVHFRTNNAQIRPVSYPLLERLAKLLEEHPEYVHIEVQGHTDVRGPEYFNKKLSQDRAESVRRFLISRGIDEKRLSAKGFGSDRPRVDKKSEHAYFLNRRVEFRVTREVRQVVNVGGPDADVPHPKGGPNQGQGTAPPKPDAAGDAPAPAEEKKP